MEEKVLQSKLPNSVKYREVIVTEDIGTTKCIYSQKKKAKVKIPKPKALVGGSKVYQKEDVPYWYCKIKDGRDTFMHVYMKDLTKRDLLYDSETGKKRKFSTKREKRFKKEVLKALKNKPKEGFRWIPEYEPSPALDGSIQFVKGKKPLVGLSCKEWSEYLKAYSPKNKSGTASKTTYFLLLLRWLKDGIATLEQIVEHSERIGHYLNSENAKQNFEKTGERRFGGLYGFVGNTCIVVEDSAATYGFSFVGGHFLDFSKKYSLSAIYHIYRPNDKLIYS